ncbi:MAG: polysaccharide biosynthesis/export family protein [Gemmatimonadetes bacterium]|nr:polysaccharide biosynthesis/export family protein [Gemmatimonadota bacterium]
MRHSLLVFGLVLSAAPLAGQQNPAPTNRPALLSAPASNYTLRPGDVLRVDVWGQEQFSGQFIVDETGHLQYPVLGDIQVSNLTVAELRERMRQGLEQIFKSPFVTVAPLFRMAVLGEVRQPGLYTVDPTLSVLDVVAMAGGPSSSGNMNKIRLLRAGQEQQLSFGQGRSLQEMGVRSGDQIVVARKSFSREDVGLVLSLVQVALSVAILINTVGK